MRKIIGRIIQYLGWLGAAWFGVAGGGFSAIYLMGFIGTGGREAGNELVFALIVTTVGVAVGLLIGKFGKWMATYDQS